MMGALPVPGASGKMTVHGALAVPVSGEERLTS